MPDWRIILYSAAGHYAGIAFFSGDLMAWFAD
jgi:hypothetical protein